MTANAKAGWVGRQFARKEDHRLTTGRGQYFGDIRVPGMLHLVFVRSVHAHARVKHIDTAAARKLPGVVAVVTGADIKEQIKPLPQPVVVPALPARYPTFWPLAVGKVKFHGEPVAAVVARDRYVAEDAAQLVEVEYETLTHVRNMEEALRPGAPVVHDGWADNEMFSLTFTGGATPETQAANDAEVDGLIKSADVVVKQRYRVHRCGVTPLETRGALATWDDGDGMTAWITTQRPHIDRLAMSDVLDVPAEKMRVIAPRDQGGGFGVKAPFYREPILVCYMARKLKRPVRWLETREEHLMSVSQERDQIHDLKVAATKEGRIVALRDRGLADNGDGCEGVYWGYLMPFLGAALLPNAYDVAKCDIKIRVAVTNKAVLSPARSFGAYPTRFAIERSIDKIAHRIGKDPADVRRLNFIKSLPHVTATGVNYDSGDFVKVWDHLIESIELPKFRAEQQEARREGRHIGVGFGVGAELSGVASSVLVPMENQPGYGAATVRLDPRGKVLVFEGDAPGGQGHETTMAQVVAQEFGIHPNDVVVTTGDTGTTPFGSGTIGARSGSYFVSAAHQACTVLKDKIARILAFDLKLDAKPADFEFAEGFVTYKKDRKLRKTFRAAVERIIMAPINLPPGESGGLDHTAFFEAAKPRICCNADCGGLKVDINTGQFKIKEWTTAEDVGRIINPAIVEGQMQGAIVQGISNTLFEQFVYDENGQQLTADFENYKLATAADVPHVKVTHSPTPCPHTPLGTRGIGEGRPSSIPGTICNAVCDALSPFGIEITELPLRPNTLWHLIQRAQQ